MGAPLAVVYVRNMNKCAGRELKWHGTPMWESGSGYETNALGP